MSQSVNSGSIQSSQSASLASTPSLEKPSSTIKTALPTSDETKSKALPESKQTTAALDKNEAASSAVPTPKSEDTDRMGSKFAALSRQNREIQAKNQEVKAELAKLAQEKSTFQASLESDRAKHKAEVEAFQSQRKEYEDFQALKKLNPLKAVEALGFTYQQLTDIILNDNKPTPEMLFERSQNEMKSQLDAYKKELEARDQQKAQQAEEEAKKALQEAQQAAEAEKYETLQAFRSEINDFVQENNETYEFININQANEIVYSVIEKHFEDTGAVMSIKDASDITEQWLEQQVQRNLATNKLKAKVSPPQAPKESTKEVNTQKQAPATKTPNTITNNMTSAAAPNNFPADSEQDRIRRALAALDRVA